jgi:phenylpyruvate tautomerase PptA (4-oxalocrotonate tautomerase family)
VAQPGCKTEERVLTSVTSVDDVVTGLSPCCTEVVVENFPPAETYIGTDALAQRQREGLRERERERERLVCWKHM